MGQYHKLINLDKKEFVDPHKLGLGLKQRDHSFKEGSIGDAIYILLSLDNGKGGGDMKSPWYYDEDDDSNYGYFGRWVGDHVAVIGDYNNKDIFQDMSRKDEKAISYPVAYDQAHQYDEEWCSKGIDYCKWNPSDHYRDISDEIVHVFHLNLPLKIVEEDAYETSFRKRLYK